MDGECCSTAQREAELVGLEVRKGTGAGGWLSALARASSFLKPPVSGTVPRRWRPEERAADYLQQPGLAAPPRPPPARPRRCTSRAPRALGTRWLEPGPSAPGSGASSLRLTPGCPPPAPCGAGRPRASAAPARPPPPRCRGTDRWALGTSSAAPWAPRAPGCGRRRRGSDLSCSRWSPQNIPESSDWSAQRSRSSSSSSSSISGRGRGAPPGSGAGRARSVEPWLMRAKARTRSSS